MPKPKGLAGKEQVILRAFPESAGYVNLLKDKEKAHAVIL